MFNKQQIKKSKLYPIAVLDDFFSHKTRHIVMRVIGNIAILFAAISTTLYIFSQNGLINQETIALLPKAVAVSLLSFSLWGVVFLLEQFFRSYYLESTKKLNDILTLEVLKITRKIHKGDAVRAFLLSSNGKRIMARCGIGLVDIKEFLQKEREPLNKIFQTKKGQIITLSNFTEQLWREDKDFKNFLFSFGIKEKDLIGAVRWVERELEMYKYSEMWWSRQRLESIRPIGRDWAYGQTFLLDKYGIDVSMQRKQLYSKERFSKEVKQLELVLSRTQEANALIVGEDGVGKMELVYGLAHSILKESVVPALENKKVIVLDTDILIDTTGNKIVFEREFLKLLNEVENAGNIILVFDDLPAFISAANSLGSELVSFIDPYLRSARIQVIATSGTEQFHQILESNTSTMRRFEKITIEEPAEGVMALVLQDTALEMESKNNILFTYPAIIEAISSAKSYFPEAVMPDKAIDLLIEATSFVSASGNFFVKKDDILELVSAKTNIPVGKIEKDEKERLMNLEENFHKRVIGQEEAVSLISNALRRARAGVRDTKKPIGSFLFIGPTGVGKTETAKALAEIFFGDDEAIIRFDMSEYQTDDALSRLIGSFENGKAGVLSTVLREKPYGVLLLDEFEKTNKQVHDLFLQILDEGFFSDMRGKRINARNIIFIATSNAGSDLIWEAVEKKENIPEIKDELINNIIKRGKFKPELLNRFDGVVLFHPLEIEHLEKIASIMLNKLKKRLMDKGVEFVVNDVLVRYVAREGYDPKFGARPMNRVIQEKIEQSIAEKLISGEIQEGSKFEFSEEDLTDI
jgi:ATP-dependent Clp protease ATP-binding subunit ClpC